MFQNVHPTAGRFGPIESNAVNSGLHAENVSQLDNRYIRCKQCGFMCHEDRDASTFDGSVLGDGVVVTDRQSWGSDFGQGGWGGSAQDPNISSGCPQCGSYMWR